MQEPDAVSGHPPIRWGLGDVLVGLLLVLTFPALTALVLGSLAGVSATTPPRWYVAGVLGAGWVALGAWPLLIGWSKGTGARRDFGLSVRGRDAWLGAATAIPVLAGIYAIGLWGGGEQVRRPSLELLLPEGAVGLAYAAFLVVGLVVVTPVVEELFFRGLVLRAGERRWGIAFGVGLSTVLFALVHLEPGVTVPLRLLAEIGLLGLVFGVLAARTGRLGPSIVAHATVNAVGVAVAFALS